jgi:hypothetical protein
VTWSPLLVGPIERDDAVRPIACVAFSSASASQRPCSYDHTSLSRDLNAITQTKPKHCTTFTLQRVLRLREGHHRAIKAQAAAVFDAIPTVRAHPWHFSALSVLHRSPSSLYGDFLWARRPLNRPKRRGSARAGRHGGAQPGPRPPPPRAPRDRRVGRPRAHDDPYGAPPANIARLAQNKLLRVTSVKVGRG